MPTTEHHLILPIDRALARLASARNTHESAEVDVDEVTRFVDAAETNSVASVGHSNDERREHPRRDSSSHVLMSFGLMDVSDPAWTFRSTPHRGHLLDLSMRGAAFESDLPAAVDSVVALRLADDEFEKGRILRAKIVRCDESQGTYRIVCRFEQELTLDDLYQYSRHRFSHDVV